MFSAIDIQLTNSSQLFWAIPLILLAVILFVKKQRKFSLILRIISALLLALALAEPYYNIEQESNSLSVVLDISSSMSEQAQDALLKQLEKYLTKVSNLSLFLFAKDTTEEISLDSSNINLEEIKNKIKNTSKEIHLAETNLQKALNKVSKNTKSSSVLLLTDAKETSGNALDEIEYFSQKGINIFPLVPDEKLFKKEELFIRNLYAPLVIPANQGIELRATVSNTSSKDKNAKFELFLGEKKVLAQNVDFLANKEKLFEIKMPPLKEQGEQGVKGGLSKVKAVLSDPDSGKIIEESYRFLTIKENEKILLLSGSTEDERILKNLIGLKGYNLEAIDLSTKDINSVSLQNDSIVIINNTSFRQLGNTFLSKLEENVKKGTGLLIIGGDKSFGLGGFIDTKLEEISPLKFVPPQTEKRRLSNAIVLLIDKSGSMADDNKIYSAKMAALSSIQSLKDDDYIGVIGFDAAPLTIIEPKPVKEAKLEAERRLRNLTAIGKTNLLPALSLARQRLSMLKNFRKHIIILSDGKIPITDYEYVLERDNLRKQSITVSAIALGIEADIPFMRILSKENNGAFHHTLDASQLPNIFIDDIKVATGEKTMHESMEYPVAIGPADTKTVHYSTFPDLLGFVETLPKKGSNLELITTKEDKVFPILSSWNYENGKVVAFTSDANGRWSLPWLRWKEFSNFWSEIITEIKSKNSEKGGNVEFDFRYYIDKKDLILDLAVFDDNLKLTGTPKISMDLLHANGKSFKLTFNEERKGHYTAKLPEALSGDYHANIFYGNLTFPELAFNINPNSLGEIVGSGINVELLENIAHLTKGKINPNVEEVFKNSRKINTKTSLVNPLFVLAFILIILEAIVRERFEI